MELTGKILSIISQDANCGNTINPEDRIVEDLKVDSLDKLMIIHDIEDEFNITVEENELKQLRIVQDIIDAVGRKISLSRA
jgi:acyl carrier protein